MVDKGKIGLTCLAVMLSALVILSYVAPVVANGDDNDSMKKHGEAEHEGPCLTHEDATSTATSDSTVQKLTQNYPQATQGAYYSDEEDEWHVEIVNTTSTGMEAPDKTVVIIDDETGKIKRIQSYTAPTISEENAVHVAKENAMSEFLEEHPDSEVWASYHGALDKWIVTAYDLETLDKMTAIVDGQTGKIQISAPSISSDNALDTAVLQPVADNFIRQYAVGADIEAEWEEGTLENVQVSDDMLVLSKDSLGYTEVGSERDDTNLQSAICGSWFTAPASGEIIEITACALYAGGVDYKAGLYKRSDGSFVAETKRKPAGPHGNWVTFEFSPPVSVTEGTDYFIVLWNYSERTTWSIVGIYYDDDPQRGGYQVDTSGGTWPDPWSPTMVDRKYSIYATYGYRSGRYTSEWYDLEGAPLRFISNAKIVASDNHKIAVNIQVSDDGSTVKDNLLLNLDDGTNIYDISALAGAKYVRIDSFLSTDNPHTTPTFHSFSIITSSDLTSEYENVPNQWRVSFVDETGVSVTVRIDAASGEVKEARTFSWKEAIEKFERVAEELEE